MQVRVECGSSYRGRVCGRKLHDGWFRQYELRQGRIGLHFHCDRCNADFTLSHQRLEAFNRAVVQALRRPSNERKVRLPLAGRS